MRHWLLFIAASLALTLSIVAGEVIPPAPQAYFNDYAGIVSQAEQQRLNAELVQFERDTSNQLVVAIFPTMQSDSSIEDYTVRVAQKWGVGQKGKSNGAVLFVFSQEHKLYLQVGYGLEGAIPDALARRIIANEIVPSFKQGQYAAGLQRGIHAIMAATRGEYKGTGRTVHDQKNVADAKTTAVICLVAFFVLMFIAMRVQRSTSFGSAGRRGYFDGGTPWISGGSNNSSNSSWSSGGDSGGFSGGGGSFGGGGAGGSW